MIGHPLGAEPAMAPAGGGVPATGAAAGSATGPRGTTASVVAPRRTLRRRAPEALPRGLARLRPGVCLGFIAALGVAGLALANPVQVAVLLAVTLLALWASGALRAAVPYLRVALYVGAFLALLNPIFSRGGLDVLWETTLGPLTVKVTVQGIAFGITSALRLATVTLAFALFTLVIDPDEQLGLLSRLSFRSGLVLSLAARLFPVFSRDAARLADAQRARGVELDRGRRRERAAARVPLLAALLTRSLERAVDVAASMEARAYGSGGRSRWVRRRRWTAADVVTAAAAALAAVALLGGLATGAFAYDFFPLLDDPWAMLASGWWVALALTLAVPLVVTRPWRR
ncbi:MAG: energy-coupling factor transporter transmembrane component T [Thermoleophilia bacterium]|nr:energy-coupling factor transporter transmembrane component T [Thermoleophilia bacterium]